MKWTEEAAKAYYEHRAAKKLAQEQAAEEYKKHKVIQQRVKELANTLMLNNQTVAANKLDIDALFQILQTTDASRAWLPPTMPLDAEAAVAVVGDMNSSFWTNERWYRTAVGSDGPVPEQFHFHPAGDDCHLASDDAAVSEPPVVSVPDATGGTGTTAHRFRFQMAMGGVSVPDAPCSALAFGSRWRERCTPNRLLHRTGQLELSGKQKQRSSWLLLILLQ
jgi:hypothetical protein